MTLAEQLKRDEDLRLVVYDDATGKAIVPGTVVKGSPTIGVGRNLSSKGLTKDEAEYLLANDISEVKIALAQALPWTTSLDDARRGVLLNLSFNMGIAKVLQFKNTLALVQQEKYAEAAVEMLDSTWAHQVGDRAKRLSDQMRDGMWR